MRTPEKPVYFDNAATTWPKPREVGRAVLRAMEDAGGNPGRGAHSLSVSAAREVFDCRAELADFFNIRRPENVVFTMNATYALNLAIKSMIRPGSRVICSQFEHNSVRRPLAAMGCAVSRFDPRLPRERVLSEVEALLRRGAGAVVCTHASNVAPLCVPVRGIAALCHKYGAVCIVDASQSAGILDLDIGALGADAVCFPGHKGLYGPAGCGVCVFGERLDPACLAQVIEGGSGVNSADAGMPGLLPERFEAGTLPVPAVAGLRAGLRVLSREGVASVRGREFSLAARAREVIGNTPGAVLYDPPGADGPVVLFNLGGLPPERTAAALDSAGICVRAGLHCAPDAHRALGTLPEGACRLSFGMFNTEAELEYFARTVKSIVDHDK